jgi:hypothetical protein
VTKLWLNKHDVDWREVDGEVIALRRSTAAYLGINGSGALLWRALDGGADEASLARILVERYGIPRDAARTDVSAFVDQLRAQGLVQQA